VKVWVKSAVWAAVVTAIAGAVIMAGAPRALAVLMWPSFPGFFLAFILGIGPSTEGIPTPSNFAVHLLTFAIWWVIFCIVLTRWRRRPYRRY
jgi:hypothetical protein